VLDASALLAVLHGERGYELAMPHLHGGLVSAVNYSEVLKKMLERGSELSLTRLHLARFNLSIVPFAEAEAVRTAEIWPQCKPFGLSSADRACLALGLLRNATIVTADQRMRETELELNIVLIRETAKNSAKS
jgi:PIN domain nuclease of toxin-antitoxin system